MRQFSIILIILCALMLCACAVASVPAVQTAPPAPAPSPEPTPVPYQSISAQQLYARMQEKDASVVLIDLQPEKYYAQYGHIQYSIPTAAYPADSPELLQRLDAALEEAKDADAVILIDMAGKAGAHNAFDYCVSKGFDGERLFILDGGMMGWTYGELIEIVPAAYEAQIITPKDVRKAFRRGETQILLDLRTNEDYESAHLKESVNIPVAKEKADSDTFIALAKALPLLKQDTASPVILLTQDGGEQAQAYYDYFARHAIPPERLFILEGGMNGWPESYAHYLVVSETAESCIEPLLHSDKTNAMEPEAAPVYPQTEQQYFG